ncbi:hypothetical protein GH733_007015 [Mirounga leonina]|nr:hypothetical protein GH733_007015 [Mirounga leonina]
MELLPLVGDGTLSERLSLCSLRNWTTYPPAPVLRADQDESAETASQIAKETPGFKFVQWHSDSCDEYLALYAGPPASCLQYPPRPHSLSLESQADDAGSAMSEHGTEPRPGTQKAMTHIRNSEMFDDDDDDGVDDHGDDYDGDDGDDDDGVDNHGDDGVDDDGDDDGHDGSDGDDGVDDHGDDGDEGFRKSEIQQALADLLGHTKVWQIVTLLRADRPCVFVSPTPPATARRQKSLNQRHRPSCSHLPEDQLHRRERCWRRRDKRTTPEMSQLLQLQPQNPAELPSGFLFSFAQGALHPSPPAAQLFAGELPEDIRRISSMGHCSHINASCQIRDPWSTHPSCRVPGAVDPALLVVASRDVDLCSFACWHWIYQFLPLAKNFQMPADTPKTVLSGSKLQEGPTLQFLRRETKPASKELNQLKQDESQAVVTCTGTEGKKSVSLDCLIKFLRIKALHVRYLLSRGQASGLLGGRGEERAGLAKGSEDAQLLCHPQLCVEEHSDLPFLRFLQNPARCQKKGKQRILKIFIWNFDSSGKPKLTYLWMAMWLMKFQKLSAPDSFAALLGCQMDSGEEVLRKLSATPAGKSDPSREERPQQGRATFGKKPSGTGETLP